MKLSAYLLTLVLFCVCLPELHAQEYGKIPHERNEQGAVVRIKMDGQWLDVTTIEIVPVLKEAGDKRQQVAAHELFFYTADGGILDLLSELTIR
jgi:hypothetical protein